MAGVALLAAALTVAQWTAAAASAAEAAPTPTVDVMGEVVSVDGESSPGAEVTFLNSQHRITAIANAAGRFTLAAPADRVRGAVLLVQHDSGGMGYAEMPWELQPGEAPAPQRIELKAPRRLRVVVATADDMPAAEAEVVAHSNYQTLVIATTDGAGVADFDVPADAPLQFVLARHAGGIDYALFRRADQPASDPYQLPPDYAEEIRLTLSPTRTVTVQVADEAGRLVAGADVHPWYIELKEHGDSANLGSLWMRTTNDRGEAAFDMIPRANAGAIVFWVRKEGFIARERTVLEAESPDAELLATLQPLVPVSGRVVHADGSPAANIPVRAAGDGYEIDGYREATTTAADGTFDFGVYPDHYCLFVAGNEQFASRMVARVVRQGAAIDDLVLVLGPATRIHGRITIGKSDKPAANEYVSLYQKDVPGYYDLPEDERLPNPEGSTVAVSPRLVQSMQTDAEGRFEFFAGPGEFYIHPETEGEAPTFTVTDQPELEFSLASNRALREGKITGRVVLASDPGQGVAEVTVFSYPEDVFGRHIRATTDAEGRFEDRRPGGASIIGVFTEDKALGAIVRIAAEDTEVTLALAPLESVTGTLVDAVIDGPAVDREVSASIRVGPEDGPSMMAFQRSATTDALGRFTITGLAAGFTYQLHAVLDRDADGQADSWHRLSEFEPRQEDAAAPLALRLNAPHQPPTLKGYVGWAFGGKPASERLARAVADAKLGYQHVLIVAADPAGEAAKRFFQFRYDYFYNREARASVDNDAQRALAEFVIVAIAPDAAADVLTEYGVSRPAAGDATLAILNAEGKLAAQWPLAELLDGDVLDASRLGVFLKTQRVELPDAQELLDEALAEASRTDKRVLIQLGGPGCGWCVVLSRFLDAHKELVEKDYVHLKLDARMPGAEDVIARLRDQPDGGLPWMAILNVDGRTLVTSDAEAGNIGYPGDEAGRSHFEHMLRTTRQRLSNADVTTLLEALADE
jgi:hypothetical protein